MVALLLFFIFQGKEGGSIYVSKAASSISVYMSAQRSIFSFNSQIQLYTQISAQSSIFSTQFSDFSIKYPTKSLISYSKFKKQQHIAAKTRKIIKITRLQISSVFKWPTFQWNSSTCQFLTTKQCRKTWLLILASVQPVSAQTMACTLLLQQHQNQYCSMSFKIYICYQPSTVFSFSVGLCIGYINHSFASK